MERTYPDGIDVRGDIVSPEGGSRGGLVLTHGAGSNRHAPLLAAVARAMAGRGFTVLCCDLPFRQARPGGPPHPSRAARDREGLRRAAQVLRELTSGPLWMGGQSYGGRQCSMLAAESPEVCEGLLLLSYPLHPPGRPERMRTEHLPGLRVPTVVAHGGSDPFATSEELRGAFALISAPVKLIEFEGLGHDLGGKKSAEKVAAEIAAAFG